MVMGLELKALSLPPSGHMVPPPPLEAWQEQAAGHLGDVHLLSPSCWQCLLVADSRGWVGDERATHEGSAGTTEPAALPPTRCLPDITVPRSCEAHWVWGSSNAEATLSLIPARTAPLSVRS